MPAQTNGLSVLADGPVLMSIREAAEVLGITGTTAYAAIANDEFPVPVVKVGARMKVSRYVLDAFLAGASVG